MSLMLIERRNLNRYQKIVLVLHEKADPAGDRHKKYVKREVP